MYNKPKYIDATISRDGSVKIETTGFSGSACKDASLAYEQALGVKTSEVMTTEASQLDTPVKVQNVIKNKLGGI